MNRRRNGFTLVELMVVIVIMAILATAAAPVFSGYVRKAKASGHLAECRAICTAVQIYLEEARAADEDGTLELADMDLEELRAEAAALTGMDSIGEVRVGSETGELSAEYYILLDDSGDDVLCTAVIYNGGKEGVWIFDAVKGTYAERK